MEPQIPGEMYDFGMYKPNSLQEIHWFVPRESLWTQNHFCHLSHHCKGEDRNSTWVKLYLAFVIKNHNVCFFYPCSKLKKKTNNPLSKTMLFLLIISFSEDLKEGFNIILIFQKSILTLDFLPNISASKSMIFQITINSMDTRCTNDIDQWIFD